MSHLGNSGAKQVLFDIVAGATRPEASYTEKSIAAWARIDLAGCQSPDEVGIIEINLIRVVHLTYPVSISLQQRNKLSIPQQVKITDQCLAAYTDLLAQLDYIWLIKINFSGSPERFSLK